MARVIKNTDPKVTISVRVDKTILDLFKKHNINISATIREIVSDLARRIEAEAKGDAL